MSTKEVALNLFNKLDERQLGVFIDTFSKMFDTENTSANNSVGGIGAVNEKKAAALRKLKTITKKIPADIDYDKELAEYREEKYGQ